MAECLENPGCREDLIIKIDKTEGRLRCAINKKISQKGFIAGCVILVAIITALISITYFAYAGRMERVRIDQIAKHEQVRVIQEKQDEKIEKQSEAINRIDKSIEKIKVRQETVIESLDDMKGMLKILIEKKVNGNGGHL